MTGVVPPSAFWSSLSHFSPPTYCQVEMGASSQAISLQSHLSPSRRGAATSYLQDTYASLRTQCFLCEFCCFCIIWNANSCRVTPGVLDESAKSRVAKV